MSDFQPAVTSSATPSSDLSLVHVPRVRAAQTSDVPGICALVGEHARRGDLLPRSEQSIRGTLSDWAVICDEQGVLACAALYLYAADLAEVRSLAVHDRGKGQGWGTALVRFLLRRAEERACETVFTLTRAVWFFQRLGFEITDRERFPQKVWKDCRLCPLQDRCDETAMVYAIAEGRSKSPF